MAAQEVQQAFEELENKFSWDPKITKWLLSPEGLGATSLADFFHSATDPKDLSTIAEQASVDNKMLMSSRIRQAWLSLKKSTEEAELLKRKNIDDVAIDDLLPQPELDDLVSKHYSRYRMTWPPEVMPSDQVISRVSKEMDKRMLGVTNVWKVKTQAMQLKAVWKKTKLGDIEVLHGDAGDDDEPRRDVAHYMSSLLSLLIAYSIPGAKSRTTAATPEVRGDDTVKVVDCPLDLLMRYYYRAQARIADMPKQEALTWLVKHDEADRSSWVDRFRNSQMTLGEVIQTTLIQREAMWEIPHRVESGSLAIVPYVPRNAGGQKGAARSTRKPKGQGKGGKGQGKFRSAVKMSPKLRDGKAICMSYNHGKCNLQGCPKGRHVCAGIFPSGRICGGQHPAISCPNRRVLRG